MKGVLDFLLSWISKCAGEVGFLVVRVFRGIFGLDDDS